MKILNNTKHELTKELKKEISTLLQNCITFYRKNHLIKLKATDSIELRKCVYVIVDIEITFNEQEHLITINDD